MADFVVSIMLNDGWNRGEPSPSFRKIDLAFTGKFHSFAQRYPEISKESSPKLEHQDVADGLEARLPVGIVGMPVLGGRFRHCKDLGASQCLNLPVA